ncbi:class I SAM-dependent methyltransferase [Natrialbaceae archaeon GCM10025810]|uniref:class I SAM-dependent methyltransferase n=1 Tax=Halovalidus salilacus TaxID=3075124 RepID=UPI0036130E16
MTRREPAARDERDRTDRSDGAGHDRRDDPAWDASAYDDTHSFVYEYGESLLEDLSPNPDERILDLGCGTGHLTNGIAERGADVVGLDRSAEMIETARSTYPSLSFVRADATEFDPGDPRLAGDEPFDAVFSNAALHWIDDPEQDAALQSVRDALRPGGRFVAELGGAGNVETIANALETALAERGYDVDRPWYFPSFGDYAPRLESHGFEVRVARLFDRPTDLEEGDDGLRNWIEMFAGDFFEGVADDEREAILEAVEDACRPDLFREEPGTWIADYRRLRFAAVAVEDDGDR